MSGRTIAKLLKIVTAVILPVMVFSSHAALAKSQGKVILIAVDNLTWKDLKDVNDPNFGRLMSGGSFGLLNLRVNNQPTRAKEFISAGASARSNAPDEPVALDVDEHIETGPAREAYERRMGRKAPDRGAVTLSLTDIYVKNSKLHYEIIPGNLGQTLAKAGKKTAVIGNADLYLDPEQRHFNREIIFLAMTDKGKVDYSDTGKDLLKKDPKAPYGLRLDEEKALERFDEFYKKADFIAIDFGDTARADMYDVLSDPARSLAMKEDAIRRAGAFGMRIKERLSDDDVLVIASINPPGTDLSISRGRKEEQLTPIIVSGPGFTGGYLTSDSTHRPGLVTNLDIAPLVLSSLGLETPVSMFGRTMRAVDAPVDVDSLIAFNDRAMSISEARAGVIVSFAVILGLALAGTVAALLLRDRFPIQRIKWLLQVATLTVVAFPLSSFLLAFYFGTLPRLLLTVAITAVAVGMAALAQAVGRKGIKPAAILAFVTLAFLAYDMLTGARFSGDTIFGYDSIVGGRFYGLGNEGLSVAIGAMVILFAYIGALVKQPFLRNAIIVALGSAVTVFIAFPGLGANLGGAPMGATATLVFAVVVAGKRWRASLIPAVLVVGALALGSVIAADLIGGAKTHVGRTAQMISSGGVSEVWLLVKRRISENLQVFQGSAWSYVLLVVVPIAAILRFRPVGLLDKIFQEHPNIAFGFSAVLASGFVGYLIEDSGIVMPAIVLAQFVPVVVYMMLSEGCRADV